MGCSYMSYREVTPLSMGYYSGTMFGKPEELPSSMVGADEMGMLILGKVSHSSQSSSLQPKPLRNTGYEMHLKWQTFT